MTHQFAEINGTRVHFQSHGAGTAVVLIHAGINDLRMWDDNMRPLAERHRVVRYDIRGMGETPDPSAPFSDLGDLRMLLEHLDIASAALVGCSGGGSIAIDFALVHPEMVDGLVLVGSGLGGYGWTNAGFGEAATSMRDAFRNGDLERAAELWTRVWVDGPTRPAAQVDPTVRSHACGMIFDSMRRFTEESGKRREIDPPAIERLEDIDAPTLVIVGEHDVPDIHAISALLAGRIPDARLVEMPDVGHLLAMEQPADFNRIVFDFLRARPGGELRTPAQPEPPDPTS